MAKEELACVTCDPIKYQTDRGETWRVANGMLSGEKWADGVEVAPIDVLHLARYLLGLGEAE